MSQYYESSQWPPSGQAGWDHQTPPPARSGASSVIPREEPAAFTHQLEEVERAIDNLVKSGKMFGGSGGRRESQPSPGPARMHPGADGRQSAGPGGSRPHSVASSEFGDARGPHPGSNLQNFYASQRHQTSRGSNEAEQMMQAKRRMAAQRERELRNYHQEQQYNRTAHAEISYGGTKPDRTLSPGGLPDDDRRKLIAQQRGALYGGEGQFPEGGGYTDETGAPRSGGFPGPQGALRGHSPLAYEYGRGGPPGHTDQPSTELPHPQGSQSAGPHERSRANSNSSPQSNPPSGSKSGGGMFDAPGAGAPHQSSRTSASSPGGSPPRQGAPGSGKPGQGPVAPIGTRPSVSGSSQGNPALAKRATTPLPSPLSQGYTASGGSNEGAGGAAPTSAGAEGPNAGGGGAGLSGWGARANNGWGSKNGLGVQASVWG